jgi:hypothetical protein
MLAQNAFYKSGTARRYRCSMNPTKKSIVRFACAAEIMVEWHCPSAFADPVPLFDTYVG